MAEKLTAETITDAQIEALKREAGCAGDFDALSTCRKALDGAPANPSRGWCADEINKAKKRIGQPSDIEKARVDALKFKPEPCPVCEAQASVTSWFCTSSIPWSTVYDVRCSHRCEGDHSFSTSGDRVEAVKKWNDEGLRYEHIGRPMRVKLCAEKGHDFSTWSMGSRICQSCFTTEHKS